MVDVNKTNDEFRHFYGMLDVLACLPVEDVPAGLVYLTTVCMPEGGDILDNFDSTYVNGRFRNVLRNGNHILRRTPPSAICYRV
ncbi:hypothetical protein DPMN_086268 [Dreissena polymorpha]|uniref:Uncharacterized protein n=1 Tax=Dreissena polymorpha TaxID=45954 RepID=A0A9D4BDJ3_DREPO|nr:hypothetical protein DPMN_086231 [Dreissena polymorpha]KAH3698721.1 hypothetical protein DPMN_086268 [Dreissena polymorpha]